MVTSKILANMKPAGGAVTDLYQTPQYRQTQAVLWICNQSNLTDSYRIALRPNGVGIDTTHYTHYDVTIAGNTSIQITGINLNDSDMVTVRSSSGNLSFVLTGLEMQ